MEGFENQTVYINSKFEYAITSSISNVIRHSVAHDTLKLNYSESL